MVMCVKNALKLDFPFDLPILMLRIFLKEIITDRQRSIYKQLHYIFYAAEILGAH